MAGVCTTLGGDAEAELERLLGGGSGAGLEGGELRLRLFTVEARTNAFGRAAFDSLRGAAAVRACVEGLQALYEVAGLEPVPCQGQVLGAPALPAVSNLPGPHRATGVVDWHGFGFHGAADYRHEG